MANIIEQFNTAFRDFVTPGVSSSGAHEPIKSEIRAIGPLIEAALGAGIVSVKALGATGDGSTDDSAAINSALSSGAAEVHFPAGTYHIDSSIEVNGNTNITASKDAEIVVGTGLLKGVRFGASSLYAGTVRGLRVVAEGRTNDHASGVDDYGFEFLNCAQASFYDLEARWFKYPVHMNSQNGTRVAYCSFINPQAIGGLRNISRQHAGTGFVNENVFLGGRCFASASTDTQIYMDSGSPAAPAGNNHNRFYGMSIEGAGTQAVYDNGHSNVYDQCRTEGTWSADDYVLGPNSLYTNIRAINLYATVTDNGLNSAIYTGLQGDKREIGIGDIAVSTLARKGASVTGNGSVQEIHDLGASGHSYGSTVRANRVFTGSGWGYRVVRNSDGFELGRMGTNGEIFAARKFEQDQSAWNLGANRHGDKYLWWDSNRYRVKSGSAPASATEGNQVQIVTSGLTAARPTTRDTGFCYFDTTIGKPVWWDGTGWVDATGTTA